MRHFSAGPALSTTLDERPPDDPSTLDKTVMMSTVQRRGSMLEAAYGKYVSVPLRNPRCYLNVNQILFCDVVEIGSAAGNESTSVKDCISESDTRLH